jgi:trimethylamine--corrinoid protein Co-methyltransferase
MRPVKLFNRLGDPVNVLTPGKVTFGTNVDTIYIMDPYQQPIRPFVKNDEGWLILVVDALSNLNYVQCLGQAHDVPEKLQSRVAMLQSLRSTANPILVFPYDRQGLLDILDIVYVVAGSETHFRGKPFLMCASIPAAPLYVTDYSI